MALIESSFKIIGLENNEKKHIDNISWSASSVGEGV